MSLDYLIGVFHVNRSDLTLRALESIRGYEESTILVDNSEEWETMTMESASPSKVLDTHFTAVPLSNTQARNWLFSEAKFRRCDVVLNLHNDAVVGEGTMKRLLEIAQTYLDEGRKWGILFTAYDALACINMAAHRDVGLWDTNLPCYYGDNDFYRRLRLAGWECIDTGLPVEHEPSQTIKSDAKLNFINSITFPLYASYYAQKWNGPPGHEQWDKPWNGILERL